MEETTLPLPPLELEPECARRLEHLCRSLDRPLLDRPSPRPAPGLVPSQRLESTWIRTWAFTSADAVAAWNAEWERALADPGGLHSALLEVASSPIQDPTLDLVARIAAGVILQEIHAGAPAPEVAPGWGFVTTVSHAYAVPAFSWQREELILTVSWSVLNADGNPLWTVDAAREYDLRRLPRAAPRVLTALPRYDTREIYTPTGTGSTSAP